MHTIGTREQWLAAREQLLIREKEHTRTGDELARQRRELPWVPVEKDYRFDTDEGEQTLGELFDGLAGQALVSVEERSPAVPPPFHRPAERAQGARCRSFRRRRKPSGVGVCTDRSLSAANHGQAGRTRSCKVRPPAESYQLSPASSRQGRAGDVSSSRKRRRVFVMESAPSRVVQLACGSAM